MFSSPQANYGRPPVSGREAVEAKGRRYLVEGRLVVEHVSCGAIRARCRGSGALYELALEAGEDVIAVVRDGSRAVVQRLGPALEEANPALLTEIKAGFAALDATLAALRSGDGWVMYCLQDDQYPSALCPAVTVPPATVGTLFGLRRLAQRLDGVAVDASVRFGDPAEEIVDQAEATGADLIAMATHRRTGLARLVRRGVAERVERATTVPVVLVPYDD